MFINKLIYKKYISANEIPQNGLLMLIELKLIKYLYNRKTKTIMMWNNITPKPY